MNFLKTERLEITNSKLQKKNIYLQKTQKGYPAQIQLIW